MEKTEKGKNFNKALMAGAALVVLSPGHADAATGTGLISANLLSPIVVTSTLELNFGDFTVNNASGGTVVIDTAGARSNTGGVTLVAGAIAERQGVVEVTAATGIAMDISVTATNFVVTEPDLATMTVNNFNLITNAGGTAGTITIVGPATNVTVPVGATLNVPINQGAGTGDGLYTGAYTVDVNYQ